MMLVGLSEGALALGGILPLDPPGKPQLVIVSAHQATRHDVFCFVTTHEEIEPDEGVEILRMTRLEDPTTGILYELTPKKETGMTDDQIDLLANYIMAHCPFEIGGGDPRHGEGAVEVAIRLMGRMADGIERALHELGVPGEGYPAPVANAVEILQTAFGLWGQGLEN